MALVRLEPTAASTVDSVTTGGSSRTWGGATSGGPASPPTAQGGIVVGGTIRVGADDQRVVLLRYLAEGTLDPAFSGNGWVAVDATPSPAWGDGLALDADGRAVLGLRTLDRVGAARVLTG